jgi:nicotinate phosphoribosyltransferase
LRLPTPQGWMTAGDDQLHLVHKGEWAAAVFWETMLLAIINELYYRSLGLDLELLGTEGRRRLDFKTQLLQGRPDIRFVEFGTRRRFSRTWQAEVTRTLQRELPDQLLGTSNVALARELGLNPAGTMAHQMFMVVTARHLGAGSPDPIASAQAEVLDRWEQAYGDWRGGQLLTLLPDTYGSPTFYRNLEPERLERWRAVRQDSGDPFAEGQRWLAYLRSMGQNPTDFRLVPSDGLTVGTMAQLAGTFVDQVDLSFGWGTNLSNNLGPAPLSMVIKPAKTGGQRCVKLSDNAAKATGPAKMVARYRYLAQLEAGYDEACTY